MFVLVPCAMALFFYGPRRCLATSFNFVETTYATQTIGMIFALCRMAVPLLEVPNEKISVVKRIEYTKQRLILLCKDKYCASTVVLDRCSGCDGYVGGGGKILIINII